ncbi:alpha/beta fold hydrolase [Kangiella sp.]|uniref:esterase/lipase family protein n=1 Tax=Kangiella sp. TaxID=1920245 RepID=UPI0019AE122B|nr:alpha/beta fold hydrolase [Kangiella sp.]MBD3652576.1 lipase [Kangiella sp.]
MKQLVILIHGMGRTRLSMRSLEKYFQSQGYHVINESYDSRSKPIETIAIEHIEQILQSVDMNNIEAIHFVTHSLGGIMLRYYLTHREIDKLGRIVMIAPPNQGSEVAELYRNKLWYKLATGKPGQQLYINNNPLLEQLKPVPTDVGIMIGTRSSDPWFNHAFAGPHDGKVSVESARLPEMKDFITVNHGHTFIMNNKTIQQQIEHFLQHGVFEH